MCTNARYRSLFCTNFHEIHRLVHVHSWVNPIVFRNKRPNRTTDMEKMCPQNQFFSFKSNGMGFFWGKYLKTVFGTPFPKKKVIFIFVVRRPDLSKKVIPPGPPKKIIFCC